VTYALDGVASELPVETGEAFAGTQILAGRGLP
jgi:hypothetical protein